MIYRILFIAVCAFLVWVGYQCMGVGTTERIAVGVLMIFIFAAAIAITVYQWIEQIVNQEDIDDIDYDDRDPY